MDPNPGRGVMFVEGWWRRSRWSGAGGVEAKRRWWSGGWWRVWRVVERDGR